MNITVFKNIWEVNEPIYTDEVNIFKRIKEGANQDLIERIRAEKDEEKQDGLKKRLPSICFSGRFSQRDAKFLLEHSGLMCLDVDEISKKDMKKVFGIMCDSEYTLACFISPRGQGLKIIVKVAPDHKHHRGMFIGLEEYFNPLIKKFISTKKNEKIKNGKTVTKDETQDEYLKLAIDKSGKDVGRVCYESYDPNIYYNPDSEAWYEIIEEKKETKSVRDENSILKNLQTWIDSQESYYKGNRNRYIYKFSSAMCRYGIHESTALRYIIVKCKDYPEKEIETTVKGAYKSPDNVFGSAEFTEEEKKTTNKKVEVKEVKQITAFWTINDKGKVKIDTKQLLKFIEANGYGIYRQKEDVKVWDFVVIKNMIVDIVDILDIKKCVLKYVIDSRAPEPVFDELQMKNRYFEKTFLNALKVVDVEQIKDNKDSCKIFFQDFYYEITAKEKKKCDYIDLRGRHIWRSQLCKENITEIVKYKNHDFNKFIYLAIGGTDDKYMSACTALGYGIHTYKKQRLTKLIYACDEGQGELDGFACGGSGKNLYQLCLTYARSVIYIDGKDFDKRDKFKFQTVRDDTQLIIIDDYDGDIKELFPKITGEFSIEKKQLQKTSMSFKDSPKVFSSSNAAPKGFSDSYARRLHILEFSNYYSATHTPSDDFGDKDFFSDDWTQADYNCMYSLLFDCVQKYLEVGLHQSQHQDLNYKQFVKNVGRNFADYWLSDEAPDLDDFRNGRDLKENYMHETDDEIKEQAFYKKLRTMCNIYGWNYEYKGVGKSRVIRIVK